MKREIHKRTCPGNSAPWKGIMKKKRPWYRFWNASADCWERFHRKRSYSWCTWRNARVCGRRDMILCVANDIIWRVWRSVRAFLINAWRRQHAWGCLNGFRLAECMTISGICALMTDSWKYWRNWKHPFVPRHSAGRCLMWKNELWCPSLTRRFTAGRRTDKSTEHVRPEKRHMEE